MSWDTDAFEQSRAKLHGIAYRMLGSDADAQDIVQEAYLRWHRADVSSVKEPEAWLVTVVTRLSIDRLRAAKVERETYVGQWIPEPLVEAYVPGPERDLEMAGDISIAFLMALERLGPEERAAFLLHDVFEVGYASIGAILDKRQDACRQIVHRARRRVRQERPRFRVSHEQHLKLLERFVVATRSGDPEAMIALFAEDIALTSDGGGKVAAVSKVVRGVRPLARFYKGLAARLGPQWGFRLAKVNGVAGLVSYVNSRLDSVIDLVSDGHRITEIHTIRNPDKLSRVCVD
jgi:RNA polymerase sigma-70 factor (ECF subfamily)